MPGNMVRAVHTIEVVAPYASLLEWEARASGRTIQEHIGHILSRRYMELIRICQCGFFIYDPNDDQQCSVCGKNICARCAIQPDELNYCSKHAPEGKQRKDDGSRWGLDQ